MIRSTQPAVAPRHMPPGAVAQKTGEFPQDPGVLPRDVFGAVEDEDHIVVLGGPGPELMCALLRAGATNVTHLRTHERPEAGGASLLIVPRPPSLDWLAAALPSVRRALSSEGRLAIHTGPSATARTQIRRMLTLHGLRAIHASSDGGWLSGDLPPHRSV